MLNQILVRLQGGVLWLICCILPSTPTPERAKHSFLLCLILLSCLVMNKICLNQPRLLTAAFIFYTHMLSLKFCMPAVLLKWAWMGEFVLSLVRRPPANMETGCVLAGRELNDCCACFIESLLRCWRQGKARGFKCKYLLKWHLVKAFKLSSVHCNVKMSFFLCVFLICHPLGW